MPQAPRKSAERHMTKTILITGASSGIGASSARRFAREGWRIVATGRRRDRLDALAADLGSDKVHTLAFDMRDGDAIEAAVDGLPQPFRGVDVLLNNAGLALGTEPAQEAKLSNWRQMIE